MRNIKIYFVFLCASLAMNGFAMEVDGDKRQGDPSHHLCQDHADLSLNSLLALPSEVIANIFFFVPLKDLIKVGQVCKLFHDISHAEYMIVCHLQKTLEQADPKGVKAQRLTIDTETYFQEQRLTGEDLRWHFARWGDDAPLASHQEYVSILYGEILLHTRFLMHIDAPSIYKSKILSLLTVDAHSTDSQCFKDLASIETEIEELFAPRTIELMHGLMVMSGKDKEVLSDVKIWPYTTELMHSVQSQLPRLSGDELKRKIRDLSQSVVNLQRTVEEKIYAQKMASGGRPPSPPKIKHIYKPVKIKLGLINSHNNKIPFSMLESLSPRENLLETKMRSIVKEISYDSFLSLRTPREQQTISYHALPSIEHPLPHSTQASNITRLLSSLSTSNFQLPSFTCLDFLESLTLEEEIWDWSHFFKEEDEEDN
ncbi:F-box protein [Candidatus Odyssella thessalonicensis]|uniref:F-box protein n=1 Tax=Candidatus Odyssella thessalonicensis TaxID=84647 RepID=UPI000225B926|nr:F-box protein [Candidatus Odyssella thessalonicensis]